MSVLGLMTSTILAVQCEKFHLRPLQAFLLQVQGQEDLDRTILRPVVSKESALVVEKPFKP